MVKAGLAGSVKWYRRSSFGREPARLVSATISLIEREDRLAPDGDGDRPGRGDLRRRDLLGGLKIPERAEPERLDPAAPEPERRGQRREHADQPQILLAAVAQRQQQQLEILAPALAGDAGQARDDAVVFA